MAEDIYTAAGCESMYQNGYVHGSPSRFLAKSAIYTAAGCQHVIAIYTAAVPEQFQTIYGATPVKKYHSVVPDENSAFKIFACASLILYCEHISPI